MKRNEKVEFQECRTKKIYNEAKIDSVSRNSSHNSGIGCVLNESTTPLGSSFPFTTEMVVPSMLTMQQNGVMGGMATVGHIFSPFRQNRPPIRNQQPISPGPSSACHVCRVCAKTFRASSLLDIHMRVHVGAKPFVCPICGHRATQKGNLKLHMKKHHGEDLPPHIDLVPDSGIWGHPQENVFFSESSQVMEGVDHDASGKRKQVAQAVSSLLNEEVVELIKKYQNEVGQGTTGTITESLEDFIRIAKNKSVGGNEKPTGNQQQKSDEKSEQGSKNRVAFSLRFQPYLNGESGTMPVKRPAPASFSPHAQSCAFCGKSYSTRRNIPQLNLPGFEEIIKLPLCDGCVIIQGYMRLMPSYFPNQRPKSVENIPESPPTINNTRSEELEAKKSLNINPKKCEHCTAFLEDSTSLQNHKIHCHGIKIDTNGEKSEKEQFLSKVGLVAEDLDENEHYSKNHITGLSPVVSHLMDSPRRLLSKSYPDISSLLSSQQKVILKPVYKKERSRKRPRSCDLELQTHAKRTRASPNVLNMLRQTLLNAADQKASSRQEANLKDIPATSSDLKKKQNIDAFSYRNPAMQSLAQIGKSSLRMENNEGFLKRTPQVELTHNPILSMAYEQDNSGYKCQYCPKWFKYRSVLEIHLRSHTGERPYKCPFCEYAGTQHNCLKLHIQRHHPDKYAMYSAQNSILPGLRPSVILEPPANKGSCFSPVNCPICGRVSPSPGYLKIHMRSHKKSLDHVCHICGRGFKEYWYLSTHLKTHERELNSMKFNMHQYKGQQSSSNSISPTGQMGLKLDRPSPETPFPPAFLGNASSFGVNTKVVKQEPMSTKHLFENYGSVSEMAQRISPNNSYIKSRIANNCIDLNLNDSSIPRPRRRKATCPSRVVSSAISTQGPSAWSKQSVQDYSSLSKMKEQNYTQGLDLSGDLPLDLRCESKKMSDINNNEDMPINLSKM